MSRFPSNGGSSPLFTIHYPPPGFEVSWAGPSPLGRGFCFGSTEGKVVFTDDAGGFLAGPNKGSVSFETINGVARAGTFVAVSTRQEVNFWPLPGTEGGHSHGVAFPFGAHGVTSTPSGYFVAPLGRVGILTEKPPFRPGTSVTVQSAGEPGMYAYAVACLRSGGRDVLAFAARSAGMGAFEFFEDRPSQNVTTVDFNGLDIVDLCPLRPGEESLGLAALGRDGSLILFKDVLHDQEPITLNYGIVEGVAYRVLSCLGDIYILTSKALYALAGLGRRFLAGEPVDGPTTPVLVLPMEAVDANLCGDRWLLVVMPDEVRKFDVRLMHDSAPQSISQGETQALQPKPLDYGKLLHVHPNLLRLKGKWGGVEQKSERVSASVA